MTPELIVSLLNEIAMFQKRVYYAVYIFLSFVITEPIPEFFGVIIEAKLT